MNYAATGRFFLKQLGRGLVVEAPLVLDHDASLVQRVDDFAIERLITNVGIEAFYETIPHGLANLI